MILSVVYPNVLRYSMVYDTGHGDEVEFVALKFFNSAHEAKTWFDNNYTFANFLNPRPVEVTGFQNLQVK